MAWKRLLAVVSLAIERTPRPAAAVLFAALVGSLGAGSLLPTSVPSVHGAESREPIGDSSPANGSMSTQLSTAARQLNAGTGCYIAPSQHAAGQLYDLMTSPPSTAPCA